MWGGTSVRHGLLLASTATAAVLALLLVTPLGSDYQWTLFEPTTSAGPRIGPANLWLVGAVALAGAGYRLVLVTDRLRTPTYPTGVLMTGGVAPAAAHFAVGAGAVLYVTVRALVSSSSTLSPWLLLGYTAVLARSLGVAAFFFGSLTLGYAVVAVPHWVVQFRAVWDD
ncbi:hypothetical protein [Halomicrobium salinisoli]|uniref:hypothetical protein n=1 Tax=Halomicrobium salinisoli TaxID=2878391 RepID=UPI001CF02F14|nr:hypothetical protein [Halomicrobium salinisoli]